MDLPLGVTAERHFFGDFVPVMGSCGAAWNRRNRHGLAFEPRNKDDSRIENPRALPFANL